MGCNFFWFSLFKEILCFLVHLDVLVGKNKSAEILIYLC